MNRLWYPFQMKGKWRNFWIRITRDSKIIYNAPEIWTSFSVTFHCPHVSWILIFARYRVAGVSDAFLLKECIIAHFKAARLDFWLPVELVYQLFPFLYNITKYFIVGLLVYRIVNMWSTVYDTLVYSCLIELLNCCLTPRVVWAAWSWKCCTVVLPVCRICCGIQWKLYCCIVGLWYWRNNDVLFHFPRYLRYRIVGLPFVGFLNTAGGVSSMVLEMLHYRIAGLSDKLWYP